jgi:starch phosphorylase
VLGKLAYVVGSSPGEARPHDWFFATALAVRDRLIDGWRDAAVRDRQAGAKRVYYLSLEFLVGGLLFDALGNLGLIDTAREALAELGQDLDEVRAAEPDPALGNGGLGRLAACFMDSMASLDMPAVGYGIRYEYGLFRQAFEDGRQVERPDDWLKDGDPWAVERKDRIYEVHFGGHAERRTGPDGLPGHHWTPAETVLAVAHDTPVPGWRGKRVNTLRLWSARAPEPIALAAFQHGDHHGALAQRSRAEAISRVLYPADETPAGQELRLRQQAFFVSASLQDVIRRHLDEGGELTELPARAALQLNDTHPSIAVVELMRLLVDVHGLSWTDAWRSSTCSLSYTNHTLLPEALETWPVELWEKLLPRHLQILYIINWLHLEQAVERGRGDELAALSLIDETNGRRVRMGHLAFVGAHKVNGVSALHTDLMRETVFRDLDEFLPGKIVNKTNGITFRRWLHRANPGLTALLVETLGPRVLDDPAELERLVQLAGDSGFQARFATVKSENKQRLAAFCRARLGAALDPAALFDVQVKRIHEYKRQTLNVLETIALWQAIRTEPGKDWPARVKIFAGKAAPSYVQAKLLIKLANDLSLALDADPLVRGRLRLVFLPNYSVSLAEKIIPAADLSEQISTAGMEASGTGNMKLALNGALTIGTLDGANIEIAQRVGPENIVIFGLHAAGVARTRAKPGHAEAALAASPRLRAVLDGIESGLVSPDEPTRFRQLTEELRRTDRYLVCSDFESYWAAQRRVEALWGDQPGWRRAAIMNTAHMGWFSSDRTIREYASEIWGVATA